MFGKELIIDLYGCDVSKFNRSSIEKWLIELCELIDMKREDLHWWDWEGVPEEERPTGEEAKHLIGTSAIQFITTSNITIHTLDLVGECYINIFSCKEFDEVAASFFTAEWFGSKHDFHYHIEERGKRSKV